MISKLLEAVLPEMFRVWGCAISYGRSYATVSDSVDGSYQTLLFNADMLAVGEVSFESCPIQNEYTIKIWTDGKQAASHTGGMSSLVGPLEGVPKFKVTLLSGSRGFLGYAYCGDSGFSLEPEVSARGSLLWLVTEIN